MQQAVIPANVALKTSDWDLILMLLPCTQDKLIRQFAQSRSVGYPCGGLEQLIEQTERAKVALRAMEAHGIIECRRSVGPSGRIWKMLWCKVEKPEGSGS